MILILPCAAPGWVPENEKMGKSRQRAALSTLSKVFGFKFWGKAEKGKAEGRLVLSCRESRDSQVRDYWREWLWDRQW